MTKLSKRILKISIIIIAVHIIGMALSIRFFSTLNIYKAGYGVCRVMLDKDSVIELSKDKVYMLGANVTIEMFFNSNSYNEIDDRRLGALRIAEKDGNEYKVMNSHSNRYYNIITINK